MDRIVVIAEDDSVSPQARTYAEYRVFAAVARHTRSVRRIRVVLHRVENTTICNGVACIVTIDLESSGSLGIRAAGPHAYAAINRAVERLGVAMRRRVERLSSVEDAEESRDRRARWRACRRATPNRWADAVGDDVR